MNAQQSRRALMTLFATFDAHEATRDEGMAALAMAVAALCAKDLRTHEVTEEKKTEAVDFWIECFGLAVTVALPMFNDLGAPPTPPSQKTRTH